MYHIYSHQTPLICSIQYMYGNLEDCHLILSLSDIENLPYLICREYCKIMTVQKNGLCLFVVFISSWIIVQSYLVQSIVNVAL